MSGGLVTTLPADVGGRAFAGQGGVWSRSIGWIDARAASGLWWPLLAAGVVLALVFWVLALRSCESWLMSEIVKFRHSG